MLRDAIWAVKDGNGPHACGDDLGQCLQELEERVEELEKQSPYK